MGTRKLLADTIAGVILAVGAILVVALLVLYYLLSEEPPGWLTGEGPEDDAW
jgi:hypothetical protein